MRIAAMLDMDRIAKNLFFEMSGSNEKAMADRLYSRGLGDISLGDVLLLMALQMRSRSAKPSKGGGDLSAETAGRLVSHGYLEDRSGPGDPEGTSLSLTDRGQLAIDVVTDGVLADRWASFPLRAGDIVICTPAKCGTTWMQMICALLVFQTTEPPAPLSELSRWLDDLVSIRSEVFEGYTAQRSRRFIKTHRSIAELPVVPHVTYLVVGRHPLDAAVSSYYQRQRIERAAGAADAGPAQSVRDWLLEWIEKEEVSPAASGDLDGTLRRIADAWARRDAPNVVLTHYEDLIADLEGQMRRLARRLRITVAEERWPALVKAATFEEMRASADRIEPFGDVLDDSPSFFQRGASGAGAELLTPAELARYHARAARSLEPDVLAWLHRSA